MDRLTRDEPQLLQGFIPNHGPQSVCGKQQRYSRLHIQPPQHPQRRGQEILTSSVDCELIRDPLVRRCNETNCGIRRGGAEVTEQIWLFLRCHWSAGSREAGLIVQSMLRSVAGIQDLPSINLMQTRVLCRALAGDRLVFDRYRAQQAVKLLAAERER